jgi:hypothetical protein
MVAHDVGENVDVGGENAEGCIPRSDADGWVAGEETVVILAIRSGHHIAGNAPDRMVEEIRLFERVAQIVERAAVQRIEADDVHIHLHASEQSQTLQQQQSWHLHGSEEQLRILHIAFFEVNVAQVEIHESAARLRASVRRPRNSPPTKTTTRYLQLQSNIVLLQSLVQEPEAVQHRPVVVVPAGA